MTATRNGFTRLTRASPARLLLAMSTAACAAAPTTRAAPAQGVASCLASRAEREAFSGVISVVHHGQSVAFVARGVLAGPESQPIAATTRFNIGSASKMFTAVAVAQLVDAGKLNFEDPVGQYVSGLNPETAAVTIHHLLTHTSGLGDFFAPQNMEAMHNARTASDLLPLIASEKPQFPPGSSFRYSNSGFALLGVLIERISGQTYGNYLRRHVFLPAGMTDTGVDPEPLATLAVGMTSRSRGGGPGSGGAPVGTGGALHAAPGATLHGSPAGGVFSTAVDMQRFATALWTNRLTSAASTAALTSSKVVVTPASASAPERAYGYGFGIRTEAGRKWIGHNGGTLGANAELFMVPAEQWFVAVLSNRDPPSATKMFEYLKELIVEPGEIEGCGRQPP